MADPIVAPYGSWRSPITTDLLLSEQVGLTQIELDGPDVYWGELRPSEGGRVVVVRRTPDGQVDELTPQGFNVRSRVHEYGGGAFAVHNGTLYFVNYSDHLVYRQPPGGAPQAITPASKVRHADLT